MPKAGFEELLFRLLEQRRRAGNPLSDEELTEILARPSGPRLDPKVHLSAELVCENEEPVTHGVPLIQHLEVDDRGQPILVVNTKHGRHLRFMNHRVHLPTVGTFKLLSCKDGVPTYAIGILNDRTYLYAGDEPRRESLRVLHILPDTSAITYDPDGKLRHTGSNSIFPVDPKDVRRILSAFGNRREYLVIQIVGALWIGVREAGEVVFSWHSDNQVNAGMLTDASVHQDELLVVDENGCARTYYKHGYITFPEPIGRRFVRNLTVLEDGGSAFIGTNGGSDDCWYSYSPKGTGSWFRETAYDAVSPLFNGTHYYAALGPYLFHCRLSTPKA